MTHAPTDAAGFGRWMRSALAQLVVHGPRTDADLPLDADDVFAPGFTERTNGQELDRPTVLARMAENRPAFTTVEIDILTVLRDGPAYALHHRMRLTTRAGEVITTETHQFGTTDGAGRLYRIDEQVHAGA
jgi:hypothetical protein